VAVVEVFLRSTYYGLQYKESGYISTSYPRFYHRADSKNGFDIAADFPPTDLKHREYMDAFGTSFTVSSNALGCRDKRMNRGDRYVLLLGDSFAWAHVPLQNAFGTVLEDLIGIRVLKCGVSGYGSRQQLYKLEQIVKEAGPPSAIIVEYFIGNDLEDDYLYPRYTVVDGYMLTKAKFNLNIPGARQEYSDNELRERIQAYLPKEPTTLALKIKDFMTGHFRVYNLLRRGTSLRRVASAVGLADPPRDSMVANKAEPRPEEVFYSLEDNEWLGNAWTMHLDNLGKLKKAADRHNAKLLIVMVPTPAQVYDYLRPANPRLNWDYPNNRLAKYFDESEIDFLDLLPEFKKYANLKPKAQLDPHEDLYWHYDGHLNVIGNRLAGLLISRYVLDQSLLNLPDKDQRLSDVKQLLSR
jgi:hypothetical protein